MDKQKVLVLDVETSPIIAYIWNLKDQYIDVGQIKNDWYLLAWSAKWLGDPVSKIIYHDQRKVKPIENDRAMLVEIRNLLDEADIIITQNGEKFDGPKLTARFILNGIMPPSPYRHLDTYKIAKKAAGFTSNKLEYLTDKLCTKYKKLSHKKFPGLSLWKECLKGNLEAWEEMKRYNIHDVLATEELYMKLRAWTPNTMPQVYTDNGKCGICGEAKLQKAGLHKTKATIRQRLHCMACGSWTLGEKVKEIK